MKNVLGFLATSLLLAPDALPHTCSSVVAPPLLSLHPARSPAALMLAPTTHTLLNRVPAHRSHPPPPTSPLHPSSPPRAPLPPHSSHCSHYPSKALSSLPMAGHLSSRASLS